MKALPERDKEQTRVAVVGTGLAGLTTAFLLKNDEQHRFSVTLFEQVSNATLIHKTNHSVD